MAHKNEGRIGRSFERKQIITVVNLLAIVTIIVAHIFSATRASYAPTIDIGYPIKGGLQEFGRRQDSEDDDDELDSNASAPNQNQGDNNQGQTDGYEENEPDGPYGATPREEEGQADLERFFDDHLGASERDGMDKENLPSNLVVQVSMRPPPVATANNNIMPPLGLKIAADRPDKLTTQASKPMETYSSRRVARSKRAARENIETRYVRLPNNRLMIVEHKEKTGGRRGPNGAGQRRHVRIVAAGGPQVLRAPVVVGRSEEAPIGAPRRSDSNEDQIAVAENDDMDRVYVTRSLNKPFKIDALGGYDPEQDFQEAERDLEDQQNSWQPRRQKSAAAANNNEQGRVASARQPATKDISFNDDVDADTMFNDASETDEITFGQDDPYQTDLEAEMRSQAYDKPTPAHAPTREAPSHKDGHQNEEEPEVRIEPRKGLNLARKQSHDDSEGNWINDGVDEMEIPTQSHQDRVLAKAAARGEDTPAATATIADKAPSDVENNDESGEENLRREFQTQELPLGEPEAQHSDTVDSENQRMPNANYLGRGALMDDPEDYEDNENL